MKCWHAIILFLMANEKAVIEKKSVQLVYICNIPDSLNLNAQIYKYTIKILISINLLLMFVIFILKFESVYAT